MSVCTGVQGATCPRPATLAIRTTANARGLVTTVYWDDTDAPSTAQRMCATCGTYLLTALARTVGG